MDRSHRQDGSWRISRANGDHRTDRTDRTNRDNGTHRTDRDPRNRNDDGTVGVHGTDGSHGVNDWRTHWRTQFGDRINGSYRCDGSPGTSRALGSHWTARSNGVPRTAWTYGSHGTACNWRHGTDWTDGTDGCDGTHREIRTDRNDWVYANRDDRTHRTDRRSLS